jgi:hypothetical protein
MRAVMLVGGLMPFVGTHPFVRGYIIPVVVKHIFPWVLMVFEAVVERLALKGSESTIVRGLRWGWTEKAIRARVARAMDDDSLEDRHWNAEMREVELWENVRWSSTGTSNTNTATPSISTSEGSSSGGVGAGSGGKAAKGAGGWGKAYLKGAAAGERSAWTRGRDGWSGVGENGSGDVRSVFVSQALLNPSTLLYKR